MRVVGFGVALLFSSVVAQKGKDSSAPIASDASIVSYSCPKGWDQDGDNCTRSTTVKAITKTETNYNEVPAVESCPYGFVSEKDVCIKKEIVNKIVKVVSKQVPEKACPVGTSKNIEGDCIVTKTVSKKVVVSVPKQVKSQRVTKKSDLVTVKRPIAAPGPVQCPKGSRTAGQSCITTLSLAGYEITDVTKELKVPKDEKIITESCAKGGKAPCTVDLGAGTQYVKEITKEKVVTITQLSDKMETLTLKSQVKVPQLVCPEGSETTKDGCVVAVTKQVVAKKTIPRQVPSANAYLDTVEKTLRVQKTSLTSSSSCPAGSTPAGKGKLSCLVSRQVQVPTPRDVTKTIRVSRAVKVPRTIKVPKTVAIANEECPKGAEPVGKGLCALTTVIKVPYTVDVPVEVCPAGATETKDGQCVKEVTEYYSFEEEAAGAGGSKDAPAPSKEVPADSKEAPAPQKEKAAPQPTKGKSGGLAAGGYGGAGACPAEYTLEEGLCVKRTTEHVATETLIGSKLQYREEVVRETVPTIVSYSTRTEYEEATIEEVHIENDIETVTETIVELTTQTVQEEVPAIISYGPSTTDETVTVTDTVLCGGGGASKGAISPCGGGGYQEVYETVLEVSTETLLEEVPKVFAYTIENHIETQEVRSQVVTSTPIPVTELTHVVESVGNCGKGSGGCTEEVPASKTVSFKTSYDTVVAIDKKVKTTKHNEEVALQGTPTFTTGYEEETLHSVKLEIETVPVTVEESKVETKTETVTQEVSAATVYRSTVVTEEGCPDGSVQGEGGCLKVSTAATKRSCPSGSIQRNGGCYEKEVLTVSTCPPGSSEENGACIQKETIPATASYGGAAATMAAAGGKGKGAPTPTKEAPAAKKRSLFSY